MKLFYASALALSTSLFLGGARAETLPKVVEFNRDIRPILSDNCYACHGPDKNSREAGLRLDTEEGAFSAIDDNKFPIVRKDPARSELMRRILTHDSDDQMPPPDSGKSLSPRQIALLEKWIKQGAPWQGHWAYLPPQPAPLPKVKAKKWARNPIDLFVLEKLEARNLKPSPEADRRTLIRRVSFDLTGLPPSPQEVEAFVSDKSPDAYERVVDRLLASPRFGERLAMRWLDLVRYADTVGYHGDQDVSIWPYRDYVISAFNANKPFDQFTIEQLAGDLLPEATLAQKVASGYNRLNMMTGEGGAQDKEYRAKYAADRVRTTASVWLGSTLGCAECHDHKFDPFTTKDFYSFEAIFADLKEKGHYQNGVWEPAIPVPNANQAEELQAIENKVSALESKMFEPNERLALAQRAWEQEKLTSVQQSESHWRGVSPVAAISSVGAELKIQKNHKILSTGANPANDIYTLRFENEAPVAGLRLEVFPDAKFPKKGLSRGNGNFVLTGFEIEVSSATHTNARMVRIEKALADFEQDRQPIAAAIDDKSDTGWAVNGHVDPQVRQAVFLLAETIPANAQVSVRMKHESVHPQHNIGHFRISLTSTHDASLPSAALSTNILAALKTSDRSAEQQETLLRYFRENSTELETTRHELAAARTKREELKKQIPTTLISVAIEPRPIRILRRGNWMDDGGELVEPAVPTFLPQPNVKDRRLTRLDLAQWIVAPENPLTARVFVNRWWKLFFGTGLSKVLDDVGSQGEWPTHPALLDYLALDFVQHGWDVKRALRQMVTSSTYRQRSQPNETLREVDPFNRLFARQARFRLDAEMVRDNALAISGLLSPTMLGPSAKPYQPAGYYSQLNFPKREYQADKGDNQYRRGVYMHWQRTFLHPMLMAFDAPSREECTAERPRSNTPLQSLTLLNDPTFVEAARVFAERTIQRGGNSEQEQLNWAFRNALGRPPLKDEALALNKLLIEHRANYAAAPELAKAALTTGDRPADDSIPPAELAAWTSVARVILNLHETITRF